MSSYGLTESFLKKMCSCVISGCGESLDSLYVHIELVALDDTTGKNFHRVIEYAVFLFDLKDFSLGIS